MLLTDLTAHIRCEVLSKNFGVSRKALDGLPEKERFIFQSETPGALLKDQQAAAGRLGVSPRDFVFRANQPAVVKCTKSGHARIVDASAFKVATTVAAALVTGRA
ncbi:MAG TPA: hypothetical protein VH639_08530 [Bryobacteraceae bacterium]